MAFFTQCGVLQILVSPSGILCSVFFSFLLMLSKKIEGLGWRNRKIDERNDTGDQKKRIKKRRKCDILWEAGEWGGGGAELGLNHR